MSWLNQHKRVWRAAVLGLLLAAFFGPWAWERLFVPAKYPCAVRLEGDFCGMPMPGTYILGGVVAESIRRVVGLFTGAATPGDLGRVFLLALVALLLVLPALHTLLLLIRGDRRPRRAFHAATWGLGAGIALVIGLAGYPRHLWRLWGIWLYIELSVAALTLELLALQARDAPGPA
jgi:hypothetical protein